MLFNSLKPLRLHISFYTVFTYPLETSTPRFRAGRQSHHCESDTLQRENQEKLLRITKNQLPFLLLLWNHVAIYNHGAFSRPPKFFFQNLSSAQEHHIEHRI
ncbi:RING finger protein [Histoplasma capsulatum var. duboisii H88]|uniref:RING finger protein n=1 Tax=Ajellomyces capsulatus (strain H88) TaxID=544711 RepID=A0A8A1LDS8_AJEC8|nr:RING finger protein [Histoplasma capsulatum var. duboisii H88]